MNVVVTELLDELWKLLQQASELVGSYASAASDFVPRLHAWLTSAEGVLNKHHCPQVSEVAGLRAQLTASADGVFDIRFIRLPATTMTRKTTRAVAALLFNQAQTVLQNVYETFRAKRDEAANYVRQMILLSLQKQTFHPAWSTGEDRSQSVANVWQMLMADADAVTAGRRVLSLVSYPDALRLVEEAASDWKL